MIEAIKKYDTNRMMEEQEKKFKIRSGQCYLYRKNGEQSTVFDIRMKENIHGVCIQQALDMALQRYPYFRSKLREENGDFYLESNVLPLLVKRTKKLYPLGSKKVNLHLIDVTYYESTIYVSFHHALCDGMGIKPFILTLLYYYCSICYKKNVKVDGIRLATDALFENETKEPFSEKYKVDTLLIKEEAKIQGFHLPEAKKEFDNQKIYYRYEVKINSNEFISWVKKNNATPSIALSLLTSQAIKNLYRESKQPIVCNLASDMRKAIDLDYTFKNCTRSLVMPFKTEMEELSFSEQATACRNILNDQRKPENVKHAVNMQISLSDKLDEFDSFQTKKSMMSFFDGILLDSYILSYLGQFNLGDYNEYIESMHMYNAGTTGLVINMFDTAGMISIDFLQSFCSNKYVTAFIRELEKHGLKYTVSNCISFSTPCDAIQSRLRKTKEM